MSTLFMIVLLSATQAYAQSTFSNDANNLLSIDDDPITSSRITEILSTAHGLKIVYHGSSDFLKSIESSAVAGGRLDEYSSNQIVVVQSANKDAALIERLLARGNFIVSVGGSPDDAAWNALNLLLKSEVNLSEEANARKPRFFAKIGNGEVLSETVAAYRFSPLRSGSFVTGETNIALGIAEAIAWATSVLKDEVAAGATNLEKGSLEFTRSASATCKNSAGLTTGTLSLRTQFIKETDTNASYDYWTMKHTTLVTPQNNYRNSEIINHMVANTQFKDWTLLDYDPTTSYACLSGSANVSFSTSGVTGGASWSYTIPNVAVNDYSSFWYEGMWLEHIIQANSSAAYTTYKVQPGSFVRVHSGAVAVWFKLTEHAGAVFKRNFHTNGYCDISLDP